MSNQLSKVFGIDLGTTYSCIAYVDEHGKPTIIPNFDSNRITPSVVFFDEGKIIVGEEAKNSSVVHPDRVVSYIKRSMGDPNFIFNCEDVSYSPEEISSYILRKLAKDAEEKIGEPVQDVVITCPAYFGINQREATRKAGEIAGLNVKAIINEPTAAAVAYGMDAAEDKIVLVYDLGGGTFDISMIEVTAQSIKVIVTDGNHELGGKDWDNTIISYLAESFKQEIGSDEDILEDKETLGELQLSAEQAKKTLTARDKTTIVVIHGGEKAKVELTREKFEELTSSRLDETISLTRKMLNEAEKKGYYRFDEIILVGGSSKMPQIKERVDKEFSTDAKIYDPDEAVAKGAAIYGAKTSIGDELIRRIAESTGQTIEEVSLEAIPEAVLSKVEQEVANETGLTLKAVQKSRTEILNVTSKSFGVVAMDASRNERLINLIMRNDTVPKECAQEFGTDEADQETVLINIMENLDTTKLTEITNGTEIGTAVLHLPAGLPEGSPIRVTFRINEEGRLKVEALEVTANRVVKTEIETNSVIAGEALEKAKERSKGIVVI
ncbi:MAG: Hsp70 family protein [Saprospiraceae bacterium]|nr:Hsp70 family protein [Saprospiraceae bacterium]